MSGWELNSQPPPTRDGMTLAEMGQEIERLRKALTGPYPYQVEEEIRDREARLFLDREARRRVDAREYAEACGARRDISFRDLANEPRPAWIMPGYLTAGVYGLGGPAEAGKSLMCRDWLCWLGAQGTTCVYAISEGQHDVYERFQASSYFQAAEPRLRLFDGPLSLASREDVDWFIKTYTPHQPGLIIFDMAYGFGVEDDDGTRGVGPFLGGCKRIARQLAACVLVTGHPGHAGGRRFRGSSMWRGAFDGEFHMADGIFTCEKHKYTEKKRLARPYAVEWPNLRMLSDVSAMDRHASRAALIADDFRVFPQDSDSARAARVAPKMNVGLDHARKEIRAFRKTRDEA